MKKLLLLSCALCFTLLIFGQRRGVAVADPSTWVYGSMPFTDVKNMLELDTALFANGGFTSLHVEVTTTKPTEFKFDRDKFEITSLHDFGMRYMVKPNFAGNTTAFTLYIYSGKMIIYKRSFSVMFDGRLNPTVIIQSR